MLSKALAGVPADDDEARVAAVLSAGVVADPAAAGPGPENRDSMKSSFLAAAGAAPFAGISPGAGANGVAGSTSSSVSACAAIAPPGEKQNSSSSPLNSLSMTEYSAARCAISQSMLVAHRSKMPCAIECVSSNFDAIFTTALRPNWRTSGVGPSVAMAPQAPMSTSGEVVLGASRCANSPHSHTAARSSPCRTMCVVGSADTAWNSSHMAAAARAAVSSSARVTAVMKCSAKASAMRALGLRKRRVLISMRHSAFGLWRSMTPHSWRVVGSRISSLHTPRYESRSLAIKRTLLSSMRATVSCSARLRIDTSTSRRQSMTVERWRWATARSTRTTSRNMERATKRELLSRSMKRPRML
mmetsp:Transcript_13284/g.41309  ORF Transcript_13284/g.41309 Transcript_13284/m.41309 type:complete len:358 (+) Transcript_13284:615-1688(+)